MIIRLAIAAAGAGAGAAVGGPAGVIIAVFGVCAACWPKRRYIIDNSQPHPTDDD